MNDPILYIDPGSITTGYAWREGDRIISGVIAMSKGRPIYERLKVLRAELGAIIEAQGNPVFKALVIEIPVAHDYSRSMGRRGKQTTTGSILILSRAVGVIQECCQAHGMGVVEIEATEWTKGFHKAYRCNGASGIAGRPIADENEADAICLMDWYERRLRHGHR